MLVNDRTTDKQIDEIAAHLQHDLGVANSSKYSGGFFRAYLQLERRVIQMEQEIQLLRNQLAAQGTPAHLGKVEKR
ncbi:MAG TPA: hypothetical protein VJW94_14605 [Candidatus Acidoferrum sp.]|nr:hypothetical protein [Candidatus Acidoferrum sp.]